VGWREVNLFIFGQSRIVQRNGSMPSSSDTGKSENNEPARILGTNAAPQENSLAKQKGELILYLGATREPEQGKGRNEPSSLESFLSTPINDHKVTVVSLNKHMQPR
jgi:hypothetical protein